MNLDEKDVVMSVARVVKEEDGVEGEDAPAEE
jgi:hypothetical protein